MQIRSSSFGVSSRYQTRCPDLIRRSESGSELTGFSLLVSDERGDSIKTNKLFMTFKYIHPL